MMLKKLLLLFVVFNCNSQRYVNLHCRIRPMHLEKRITSVYMSHPMIRHGHDNELNGNWTGYVLLRYLNEFTPESIRTVWGTWQVPKLQPSKEDSFCSIWIGMDGFNSKTLQQIGTSHNWVNGKQENFVWFQLYPDTPYEIIDFPVDVGDSISGSIVMTQQYGFDMRIFNNTKKSYSKVPIECTQSFHARRSSAQWIVEPLTLHGRPLPLANFGTINFSECNATVAGYYGSLNENSMAAQQVAMTSNKLDINKCPSALSSDGKCFSVKWKKE